MGSLNKMHWKTELGVLLRYSHCVSLYIRYLVSLLNLLYIYDKIQILMLKIFAGVKLFK